MGGKRHGRIAGVDAGFLDVLQQPSDDHVLAVRNAVDVDLDCVFQELVDEDGLGPGVGGRLEGDSHVSRQLFLRVDDFHRATAQDVARPNHHRESDSFRHLERVFGALGYPTARTIEVEFRQKLFEALPIFGPIDRVSRGCRGLEHPVARAARRASMVSGRRTAR